MSTHAKGAREVTRTSVRHDTRAARSIGPTVPYREKPVAQETTISIIGKKLQQKGPDILRYLMLFAIKRPFRVESLFLAIHVTSAVKISKCAIQLLSRERDFLSRGHVNMI